MKGLSLRLGTNIAWLVGFSVVVVVAAFLTYAGGVLFDDSYMVSVEMPEAGGVLPTQEVTVLGNAVGQVDDVRLSDNGVVIDLRIDGSQSVPGRATVQVLRRSPIGEQAVDFQPGEAPWTPAEPGQMIEVTEAIVPAEVPFLLEQTVELFDAVEVDDLSTVIEELAIALDDRGGTLVELGRDSLDLQRTLVAGIPELERLTQRSTNQVLDTLAASGADIAETFDNAAALAELLEQESPTVDALLDQAPVALAETTTLIEDQSANIGCLMGDLIDLNEMILGPSTWDGTSDPGRYRNKLHEFERGLQLHDSFFQNGFSIVMQPEYATGVYWARIDLLFEEPGGERYPQKRATPPTRPGAACVSDEFGLGVNAVRQADVTPADPTSPGIQWAELAEGQRGQGGRVAAPSNDADGAPAATISRRDLAATGGGALVLAPLLLGFGLLLRRRFR